MEISSGMEFWVNDKGRVRLFTIAESNKSKAQALLRDRLPGVEFTTWQPLPSGVIMMLKCTPEMFLNGRPTPAIVCAADR
jgi:hypothetical protein